jgi:hypothetical protein
MMKKIPIAIVIMVIQKKMIILVYHVLTIALIASMIQRKEKQNA